MNFVTRKEFAAMCGDTPQTLNVNIGRNKITLHPEDKRRIDPNNPLNKDFMIRRRVYNFLDPDIDPTPKSVVIIPESKPKKEKIVALKPEKEVKKEKPIKVTEPKPVTPQQLQKEKFDKEDKPTQRVLAMQMSRDQKRVDQEQHKKDQDLALTQLRIEKEQFYLNKAAGKLLPVDMVSDILTRQANTIFKEFEKGVELLATIFCNIMAGGDTKMKVRIVADGKRMLTQSIEKAGVSAKKEMEVCVDQYSESLMRGQKKTV